MVQYSDACAWCALIAWDCVRTARRTNDASMATRANAAIRLNIYLMVALPFKGWQAGSVALAGR